jgi:hypothetical protein
MNIARSDHSATLLPNGKVLVAGGVNPDRLTSAELYDPLSGRWTATGSLTNGRLNHTATLLPSGEVLVAAGNNVGPRAGAELYDVGLGFSSDWQPNIATATLRFSSGNRLFLAGSRFQGISQASGGNTQDSSSNYPVVQLRSINNEQVAFLLPDSVRGWADRNFLSSPLRDFPSGPALVTVFTNGIPSTAEYLVVGQRVQE